MKPLWLLLMAITLTIGLYSETLPELRVLAWIFFVAIAISKGIDILFNKETK